MPKLKNKYTGVEMDFSYDTFGKTQSEMYKNTGMWEEVDSTEGIGDISTTIPKFNVGFTDDLKVYGSDNTKNDLMKPINVEVSMPKLFGDDEDENSSY